MSYKKTGFLLLILFLLPILLTSCSNSRNYAVNISGAKVTREVYTYYLDKVVSKPSAYELPVTAGESDFTKKADELCAEYVAVNSALKELKLTLSSSEKAKVSENVNNFWRIYAKHYLTIGVSKQTITKIETGKAAKDKLFLYNYDTSGSKAVKEEEIKAYFLNNYVAFKVINGYLTQTDEDGNTVPLTDKEAEALKSKFNTMAQRISRGETIEEVGAGFDSGKDKSSTGSDITVISKENSVYPAGFFDEVAKLKYGAPKVILLDKYIFLVVKEDISSKDDEYYSTYREDCLKAMKGSEMNTEVTEMATKYTVSENERVIRQIFKNFAAG